MNRYAYRTTGLAIQTLSGLSKAQVSIHGQQRLPRGPGIFVINHFTRIETILLPYHIHQLTGMPVWSLAADELFTPALSAFLDRVGVVSTRHPHRDLLIVKSILAGEASWIIYPEGRMVKNKKIMERGRLMVVHADGKHPPHTGAAALALRCEFYRQRIGALTQRGETGEVARILEMFGIADAAAPARHQTHIIPVNITYYPLRARENVLTRMAGKIKERLSDRMMEELATEGSMLLGGVDVDVRIGRPLAIAPFLDHPQIASDIAARRAIDFDDVLPSRRAMQRAAAEIMQSYMRSIYSMTTVNHDHLFAAMLRALIRRRISGTDLRRRVFLATGRELEKTGVHCHRSLADDQGHLLTDDRYHKAAAFLSLAAETGVVTETDAGMLCREPALGSSTDFHRVRVVNPVAVMANEIEPLDRLRGLVRRIAWLPSGWVRRRVVRRLTREALAEYEADYDRFHVPGESKDRSVGRPFLIRGRSRAMGVVLIHGYMAAPPEVRGLAEYLGRRGLWVYVPRLRGHGTSPEDLATRSYTDWIESVDHAYAVVRCLCRRVVVGGFSTGAGLALDLAARIDGIDGVFAVSPPMRLQDFSARFAPAVDVWNRLMKKVGLAGAGMEFIENQPENPHINYHRNPIAGIRELERLMDTLPSRLAGIGNPALVVQSQRDPVVSPEGSKAIFDRLGSVEKTYTLVNIDRHGILLGPGSQQVYDAVGAFIGRLFAPGPDRQDKERRTAKISTHRR
jgi:esterase/lipase/1-acyl-sn-glycerol-3-phosphate acyltransferase